ncbi:MAG: hypothetical protein OEW06_00925 [Gemmatimonadota bacterium]|nr:hypothetical protein [Gemmatimonadota bacterium]
MSQEVWSGTEAHPLDATVRYERFDDDGMSAEMGILSVRDRASVGGHFTLYEGLGSVYVVEAHSQAEKELCVRVAIGGG